MVIIRCFACMFFKGVFSSGVWDIPPEHELVKVQWFMGRFGRHRSHSCRARRHFPVVTKVIYGYQKLSLSSTQVTLKFLGDFLLISVDKAKIRE